MRRYYLVLLSGLFPASHLFGDTLTIASSSFSDSALTGSKAEQSANFPIEYFEQIQQFLHKSRNQNSTELWSQPAAQSKTRTDFSFSWTQGTDATSVNIVLCSSSALQPFELSHMPGVKLVGVSQSPTEQRYLYRFTATGIEGNKVLQQIPDVDQGCSSIRANDYFAFFDAFPESQPDNQELCPDSPLVSMEYTISPTLLSTGFGVTQAFLGLCCCSRPQTRGGDEPPPPPQDNQQQGGGGQPPQCGGFGSSSGGGGGPGKGGNGDDPDDTFVDEEDEDEDEEDRVQSKKKWNGIIIQLIQRVQRDGNSGIIFSTVAGILAQYGLHPTPQILSWAASLPGWEAPARPKDTKQQWACILVAAHQQFTQTNSVNLDLINFHLSAHQNQRHLQSVIKRHAQGTMLGRTVQNQGKATPTGIVPGTQQQ